MAFAPSSKTSKIDPSKYGLVEDESRKDNQKYRFYISATKPNEEYTHWYRAMTRNEFLFLEQNNQLPQQGAYGGLSPTFEYSMKYVSNKSESDCIIQFECKFDIDTVFENVFKWQKKTEDGILSWGLGLTGNTPPPGYIVKTKMIKSIQRLLDPNAKVWGDEFGIDTVFRRLAIAPALGKNHKDNKKIIKDAEEKQLEEVKMAGWYLFNHWLVSGSINWTVVYYRENKQ
eukprot:266095_1